jgi:endoglucanase
MDIKLLKKLSEACGVSGFEGEVRELIKKEISRYVDKIEVDVLGNLIALKKGNKGSKKIALFAHMDEIGLFVKHIDDKGFIYPAETSSIDPEILLGREVIIKTRRGDVEGVFGYKQVHLKREEEAKKKIEFKDLFVDIGVNNKKEVEKLGVEVGHPMFFKQTFTKFGKDLIKGKALDNRLGCYVLIQLIKKLKSKNDIYFVFSVQEEVGLKGARVVAYKLNPDFALVVDTGGVGGIPLINEKECDLLIGKGPIIVAVEASGRGSLMQEEIKNKLIDTAKENKIPYQIEVSVGSATESMVIQLTREGINTGGLGIPCRYIHSPIEIASKKDIENTIKLTELIIKNWK